ncbi:MAG: WD40 repeat domain-containing protein, partial [Polyangiales bacterium]
FHGELVVYDHERGVVVDRRDMGFGPGITVDFSPCGRHLAVGGYSWRGRVVTLDDHGAVTDVVELPAQSRGVLKSVAFASSTRLLAAAGDGHLLVWDFVGDHEGGRWVATRAIRGTPHMELGNGVTSSPDGRVGYIVSRDQTVRAFELDSGRELGCGLAHVRGVKAIHASADGALLATGAYDRTVILWSSDDLSVRLPPVRGANSGVSGVRVDRGRVFSCSFDGVVNCIDAATGRTRWTRTSADAAESR